MSKSRKKKKQSGRVKIEEKRREEEAMKKKADKLMPLILAISVAVVALLVFGIYRIFFYGDKTETADAESSVTAAEPIGTHHAEIDVENYGTIAVELDGDTAPVAVQNFMDLANSGFYNGLTFHRVIDGFMIQGGDPNGDGTGGSENTIVGEFSENGYDNGISHVRGVISMARSNDYNSASSQFFIVQSDSTNLDGEYAAFGHVTDGMDIVDAICADTPVQDSNGTVLAEDQPVITSIRVID